MKPKPSTHIHPGTVSRNTPKTQRYGKVEKGQIEKDRSAHPASLLALPFCSTGFCDSCPLITWLSGSGGVEGSGSGWNLGVPPSVS